MIIGIVGPIKAGKGTAASILKENYDFSVLSFGEEVRLESRARGIEVKRENLQSLGSLLTHEFGGYYWAHRLLGRIEDKRNYAIEGFRYPEQIEIFRERFGEKFTLLGITAHGKILKNRYESEKLGKRQEDTIPFEVAYSRDWNGHDKGQFTKVCYSLKNFEIINNTNCRDDLIDKIDSFLKIIEKESNP